MIHNPGSNSTEAAAQVLLSALSGGLEGAGAALRGGEGAEAERLAKAVSALVRAGREVMEFEAFVRAHVMEEDEEALRAELRGRVARFSEACRVGAPADELDRILSEETDG